jgi:signal-transduction protein with cAMP-binding, CBS, and nucleotidyltransferase domain
VLVCGDDGRLCGIVTDRDLVLRCLADRRDADTPLRDICSSIVNTLAPDASIDDAVSLMTDCAVRRIPVVEDGELVGIVSLGDLAIDRDPNSALAASALRLQTPERRASRFCDLPRECACERASRSVARSMH